MTRYLALLLALLPAAIFCDDPVQPHTPLYTVEYLEKQIKPCLVDKKCLGDFHVDYDSVLVILQAIKDFKTPTECACSLDSEDCVRKCYYARAVQITQTIAIVKKLDTETNEQSLKKYMEYLENMVKSCVLNGTQCYPGDPYSQLNIAQMKEQLQSFDSLSILPDGCKCDLTSETCARPCYYSVVEKHDLGPIKPADTVVVLLSAPFKPNNAH